MYSNEDTVVVRKPDANIGRVIDKYKLLGRIGAGGMGLVYRAEQARIKREVAMKLLPFTLINDEVNVKRIEREATAMGKLRHPNIATIFDFGFSEEGQPYLVMELITGRSLGQFIAEPGDIDLLRTIRILVQVADAMDYAHRNGIIHRDLKPDNIMLDSGHTEDFVKVLDFGIAKSVDDAVSVNQSITKPGTMIGSPLYMSPEQCMGQKLDATSDVYSLGVIMYQILTGVIPCKGATIYETIGKKTTELPPPFPPERDDIKPLEELTLSCLATLRTQRPESMTAVKERLEAILNSIQGITSSQAALVAVDSSPNVSESVLDSDSNKKALSSFVEQNKVFLAICACIVAVLGFVTFQLSRRNEVPHSPPTVMRGPAPAIQKATPAPVAVPVSAPPVEAANRAPVAPAAKAPSNRPVQRTVLRKPEKAAVKRQVPIAPAPALRDSGGQYRPTYRYGSSASEMPPTAPARETSNGKRSRVVREGNINEGIRKSKRLHKEVKEFLKDLKRVF